MDTSSYIAKHALDSKTATALFAFRKKYAYAERRRRIINSWWLIEMILALRTGQAEKRFSVMSKEVSCTEDEAMSIQ